MSELVLEGRAVVSERPGVPGEEVGQRCPEVGDAEHRVVGDLVEAYPEPEVLGRQAPVGGERLDIGDDDQQIVAVARDGQVVRAEATKRQPADHRAGCDTGHHRRHGCQ